MAIGLKDIAPLTETVRVNGADLTVGAITAAGVASLIARFPEVEQMLDGKDVSAERLLALSGDLVAAIIAVACGYPGDREAEEIAARLSIDDQARIIEATIKLSMPRGVGPFIASLSALRVVSTGSAKGPATKSPKPSKS